MDNQKHDVLYNNTYNQHTDKNMVPRVGESVSEGVRGPTGRC
jgi:hypothetical protein